MPDKRKEYLGDSVYAENGLPNDPSNTIYLEPEVLVALQRFQKRMTEQEEP